MEQPLLASWIPASLSASPTLPAPHHTLTVQSHYSLSPFKISWSYAEEGSGGVYGQCCRTKRITQIGTCWSVTQDAARSAGVLTVEFASWLPHPKAFWTWLINIVGIFMLISFFSLSSFFFEKMTLSWTASILTLSGVLERKKTEAGKFDVE